MSVNSVDVLCLSPASSACCPASCVGLFPPATYTMSSLTVDAIREVVRSYQAAFDSQWVAAFYLGFLVLAFGVVYLVDYSRSPIMPLARSFPKLGKRVAVVGNCGSGKSFVAGEISRRRKVPYISDDGLVWLDDWKLVPREHRLPIFTQVLKGDSWVIDGMAQSPARPHNAFVHSRVDTVIFIDLAYHQNFWQLLSRTVKRIRTQEQLHGTNNKETWRRQFFSSDSILLSFLRTATDMRRGYTGMLRVMQDDKVTVHLRSREEVNHFLLQKIL